MTVMLAILGYGAVGYLLITATLLAAIVSFFAPVVLLEAASDPDEAKSLARDVVRDFLPVVFGWPLAPFLMLLGAVRLVTR